MCCAILNHVCMLSRLFERKKEEKMRERRKKLHAYLVIGNFIVITMQCHKH